MGFETGQYSDAIALAQRAEQVFGEGNVVVTGHSLGGGLASAAALATGASGVTFNAAGLSNETLESLGFNPNAVRDSVSDSGQLRRYIVKVRKSVVKGKSVSVSVDLGGGRFIKKKT